MKNENNILVFSHWSFKDALIQTYTLPYVDIIRKIVSSERKIFLVTAEQQQITLTKDEIKEINREWTGKNMQLLAQPYKRFGLKKIIAAMQQQPGTNILIVVREGLVDEIARLFQLKNFSVVQTLSI